MCDSGCGSSSGSELFYRRLVIEQRFCVICNAAFAANKYSPRQKVCSKPECQRERQIRSMKEWRSAHPDYFKYDESKGESWLQAQRERSRSWRQNNPDKIRSYRQRHIDEYRGYMREYMRRYRQKRKSEAAGESTIVQPPETPMTPPETPTAS